jgi:hypothetical protein
MHVWQSCDNGGEGGHISSVDWMLYNNAPKITKIDQAKNIFKNMTFA